MTIASGAALSLGGLRGSIETLNGTVLENAGAAALTSVAYPDGITFEDGAGIVNQRGFSFTILDGSGAGTVCSDNSPSVFHEPGELN